MPPSPWGATPDEWRLFSETLGLTADLLPVVSNPLAIVSPKSTMKQLGKTPSRYNAAGQVVGIPQWTSRQSSAGEVQHWSQVVDYGICLQTRRVRALDIDVEDKEKSREITDFIDNFLVGTDLLAFPLRTRGGSGKCLYSFRLEGDYAKRVLHVGGGIVEFLADGQQFIAGGTHPSGQRYSWSGLLGGFPETESELFENLWSGLVKRFGTSETRTSTTQRKKGENLNVDDPVVERLDILGSGPDGQLYINCPFNNEHTTPGNPPDTCYFPAGTQGYIQGHFKCLHAHCSGRTDADFLDALSLREGMFQQLHQQEGPSTVGNDVLEDAPLPPLKRKKDGSPEAILDNIMRLLARPDWMHMEIAFDEFTGGIMKRSHGEQDPVGHRRVESPWLPFKDTDYTTLRQRFDQMGWSPVGREQIRDCVEKHAELFKFDSAKAWAGTLPAWDGVARVSGFLHQYLGVADSPYTTAVSRYLWTALAGRLLVPGIKADMAVILSGSQGTGKSGMTRLLAPSEETFAEIGFGDGDDTLARRLRGKIAVEIGELKGLHNKEMEYVKGFIVRQVEEWIPKYREFPQSYPRRCIFVGTTNADEFLADHSGNRRWLPVVVGQDAPLATVAERARGTHAFEAFKRDRLQFWAEALVLFKSSGILANDAETLARDVHKQHMLDDSWETAVEAWLKRESLDELAPGLRDHIKLGDVLREALSITSDRITKGHEMRMAGVLKGLGYERRVVREDGKVAKVWVKGAVH